ncbi:MAG: tRNA threonylcarbamoyladenosine dehydratase [Lachnospiraceae bacterium]|nr:tRNA threonylcarbamoyladenosine dehydratase [Lachnospiraceae bacterium]
MDNRFVRTKLVLGEEALKRILKSRVAVFGIGGVGSFVVEGLVRSGIGAIDIYDNDTVSISNINRQLYALESTIGRDKVDVAKERIHDINPEVRVSANKIFVDEESISKIDFSHFDYVVDAIDTVASKVALAKKAYDYGVNIISAMGAGNKIDPLSFEVSDIYDTSVCPLARKMRNELKKVGVKSLKVVYSKENPKSSEDINCDNDFSYDDLCVGSIDKKKIIGSVSFVPPVVGYIIVSEVIKDLINI